MKQTALITGASSGIGYELAKLFARDGYDLILIARGEERLRSVAEELANQYKVKTKAIAKDLSLLSSSAEIYEQLTKEDIEIDVLINDAGFATFGPFAETELYAELDVIQVNITTLTQLTKLFLDGMVRRNRGRILNVASTAGFQPGPLMAIYYASKAYVISFSEALANELRGTDITVTALCPGPTRTGFQKRANMEDSKLSQGVIMDAATVARIGYKGLMKGKTIVIPGFKNKLLALSVRLSPRKMVTDVVRRMQELRIPK
ncbi:MAG TPA: SDR family oxidoreductase [Candidatus Kapabacteria bacterium]|nr:SDR family oxidoreductase [Candidatus Kapabacteria bacterium]